MEVFYHGTCRGIYITSSYTSAALYASKVAKCHGSDCKYVYTLEVPDLTDDNHLFSCKPVNTKVAERLEKALGETIPEDAKLMGKFFRKYIGNLLIGNRKTIKQMTGSASSEAEDAVTKFLNDNGVIFLAWPQAQTKPDGDTNRAVLNAECIRVVKVEQVQTDDKNKLIKGSETIVKQF